MKSSNTKYIIAAAVLGIVTMGVLTTTVLNIFSLTDKAKTGELVAVGDTVVDIGSTDTGNYKVDLSEAEGTAVEEESNIFKPFEFGSGMTELFTSDVENEKTLANSFKTLTTKTSNSYTDVSKRFYKVLEKVKLINEASTTIKTGEGGGILTLSYGGKDFQLGIKYPEDSDGGALDKSNPESISGVSVTLATYNDSPIEIRRDLRIFSKKHYMESILEVICGSSTKGYINVLPLDIGSRGKTVYLVANNSEYVDLYIPFSDGTLGHVKFSDVIDLYPSNIYAMVTCLFDKSPEDIMTNKVRTKKYKENLVRSFKGKRTTVGDLEDIIVYGNVFSVGTNRMGISYRGAYKEKMKPTEMQLTGSTLLTLDTQEGYSTGVGDYSDTVQFSIPNSEYLLDNMPEIEGQGFDISVAFSGIETVPMAGLTEDSDYSDYMDSIHVEVKMVDSKKCRFAPTNKYAGGSSRYASMYKVARLHTGNKETVVFWYDAVTNCITDIYYINANTAKGKVRHMSISYNNPVVSMDNLTTFVAMLKGETNEGYSEEEYEGTKETSEGEDLSLSPDDGAEVTGELEGVNITFE